MPAWRSQTSVSGIAPSDHRQRAMPASRSGVCLENTSAPGARARVAQACDDDPCPPGLAVPDRDLPPRLPEIELADLARAINRALKRPRRRREQRADFAQVVVDDRLAAIETELHDQLADALPRQPRIRPEQPVDLVLERIELRSRRRPRITRPVITPKRVADRLPVQARPAMDLPDRQAAHEMQPPHLRPLLHSDHLGPPKLALRKRTQAPRTPGRSGGPVFNRRRWSSFHPAPTTSGCPRTRPDSSLAPAPLAEPVDNLECGECRGGCAVGDQDELHQGVEIHQAASSMTTRRRPSGILPPGYRRSMSSARARSRTIPRACRRR